MSAKKFNFKFCKKCKQEVNFGEYKEHRRMGTKYHNDFLARNLMWSQGRLRLIDPDHFRIHDLCDEFSTRTKLLTRPDSALRQLERAITQVSQQLIEES